MARAGLPYGPIGPHCAHLCLDMQRLFAEQTDWHTPWLPRVLPLVQRLAEAHPSRTIFTRFIPPASPQEARGSWRRYYERWPNMTTGQLEPQMLDLVPELGRLVPPARIIDKSTYSPWHEPALQEQLEAWDIDTLIVTGTETDVCVLAAVLGAIDYGYRVIVPEDALCSSADHTHEALLTLYRQRYSQQIETTTTATLLDQWQVDRRQG